MVMSRKLKQYQAVYGDIIFPDCRSEGQTKTRRDIYANPAGWMYSYDGLHWQMAPMDIGKINYSQAMFRRIPNNVIVGVNEQVKTRRRHIPTALIMGTHGSRCAKTTIRLRIRGFTMDAMIRFGSNAAEIHFLSAPLANTIKYNFKMEGVKGRRSGFVQGASHVVGTRNMRTPHFKNYIVLVDMYRRSSRCRNTRGRYRVGAKNPREARKLVQAAIGFGSVLVYYEDSHLLARYREVLREQYVVGTKENLGFRLLPVRHATASQKQEDNHGQEKSGC